MNYRMLLQVVGWLLMVEAVFLIIPTITSLCYGEAIWKGFLITTILTGGVGLNLAFKIEPRNRHLGKREGFLLTASVWVIFSFFGLIPFMFGNHHINVTDAFFEAMSGFTTTGATVFPHDIPLGHGIHLWRAMMQWIGGMGIILFTLALLPMLNSSGGMQMFNAEVTGITHDKIRPRVSQTAKSLWLVYIVLTVALIILLWIGPMDLFQAICHAFGTISTGGYSTEPDGIAVWCDSLYVKLVVMIFMLIGGVNFGLIYKCSRGNFKALKTNNVFVAYMGVILGVTVLFVIGLATSGHWGNVNSPVLDSLFQVISTVTSTGFTLVDVSAWGPFVIGLSFVLMFCGGCAGSTSGGAKIDRMVVLVKNSRNELYRALYPYNIYSVKLNGRAVDHELVDKVIGFLCFYVMIFITGGILLTAAGMPVVDSFFSAFSCISNTGLDAGVTGYGSDYVGVPDVCKWILSILMLTGRLEIYTILILLTPAFWQR